MRSARARRHRRDEEARVGGDDEEQRDADGDVVEARVALQLEADLRVLLRVEVAARVLLRVDAHGIDFDLPLAAGQVRVVADDVDAVEVSAVRWVVVGLVPPLEVDLRSRSRACGVVSRTTEVLLRAQGSCDASGSHTLHLCLRLCPCTRLG